ncbi:tRNA 2-selenouridine(34) synthase MnmH [Chryseolinea sp. H1M3-3]|uniref:tRNA 2-selenouridine(34) synthase MnmH n=1 Tax=Chryseolinea sp. H1M3-3 TaxID=3034144 RepID=UPI0023EAB56E|nr:tRNA 2-selenouridine(34) synthase MnmH [Chryseolinea sp. H1M3-3]
MILTIDDFLYLRNQLPVIDVRSEGEYEAGHVISAINIPLLNNEERVVVGTTYKQKGQQEAIMSGFRLVGPRLADIIENTKVIGNELIVHCWRGGMRSSNFCQFISMTKIKTHQLKGGYKAYRQVAVESFKKPFKLFSLTGFTGSGKTEILRAMADEGEQILDLEKIAHHKGSVFGGLMMPPQPTTEQFQNNLFEEILKLDLSKRIWIEDESIAVGEIFLPEPFWKQMTTSTLMEINVPKEIRINRLVKEYGHADREKFLEAMTKITKKLGGQHYIAAKEKLLEGDMSSVIDILLSYYDKAYRNGIEKKKRRIKLYSSWNGTDVHVYARQLIKEATTLSTFA